MHIENDAIWRAHIIRGRQIAQEERQPLMMTGNSHVFFARIKPDGENGFEGFDTMVTLQLATTYAQQIPLSGSVVRSNRFGGFRNVER